MERDDIDSSDFCYESDSDGYETEKDIEQLVTSGLIKCENCEEIWFVKKLELEFKLCDACFIPIPSKSNDNSSDEDYNPQIPYQFSIGVFQD